MALFQGKNLTSSNLVLHLDATNTKSYSGSGNTWYDLSGFGNNGTLNNGVLYNSYGGFFEFDGSNDYIEIPHASSLNIGTGTSATIEIIFDVYNYVPNASLIAKRSADNNSSTDYMIYFNTTLSWLSGNSGTGDDLVVSSFQENRNIQTVTTTINSSTTNKKIYKDGSQVISASYASKVASNSSSVFLGKYFGSGFYFTGRIYSVKIYNRELTDAEIANNFQANKLKLSIQKPVVTDGLQIFLDANSPLSYAGVGTVWYDISGNNNHVTLFNGVSFSGSGQSAYFYFDGTNDYGFTGYSDTVTEGTYVVVGNPDGPQVAYAGFIYDRGTATGLQYNASANFLGYNWNNTFDAGQFTSNLTMPNNSWLMASAAVEPTQSRLSLNKTFAYNNVSMASHSYANIYIGYDPGGSRYFKGKITKALVYDRALNQTEILSLYRYFMSDYHKIPQQNLILHLDAGNINSYPGTGTSWYEISGSGSTATLTGGPTFTSSYGGGFVFSGTDQYATVPTASRFDLGTGSATIIAWFKLTAAGYKCIASKRNGSGFQLYSAGGLYADGAGTAGKTSSQSVNNGRIFCGAVVYDRAASLMRLYINGVEDGSVALASTTLTDVADVNIGRATLGGNTDYFNGTIYQVQIYNKALNPKEMRENFELMRSRYGV